MSGSIWQQSGDLLGFEEIGHAYLNVVKSLNHASTISIEAGFGRGKTFFRVNWAKQLADAGEIVVEIDARKSDHTDDPVVTFLGALMRLVPPREKTRREKAWQTSKHILGATSKAVAGAVLREGAEELGKLIPSEKDGSIAAVIDDLSQNLGDGLSRVAGTLIAEQMRADEIREKELPEMIGELHKAIAGDHPEKRIIILIDELDRCHPEYAISLLEAMKLVFDHKGFIFVLMSNPDYLEGLASHRFGIKGDDERYLDKFVDIRLRLNPLEGKVSEAAQTLARELPLNIPYGDDPEFLVERAARLAGELAPVSKLSTRQIERVIGRVDLALRCYRDAPIDAPLLVFLAFREAMGRDEEGAFKLPTTYLPRAELTPKFAQDRLQGRPSNRQSFETFQKWRFREEELCRERFGELLELPEDRYRYTEAKDQNTLTKLFRFLANHYLPDHIAFLEAARRIGVADQGTDDP